MQRISTRGACGIAVAVLCFAAAGGSGCNRGKRDREGREARIAPAAWFVRIGSQGGFTGGGSGYVIHGDGRVTSWSQITPGDSISIRDVGLAPQDLLATLESRMRAPELARLHHQETGNMTAFLEWHDGAEIRRWTWVERMRDPALPAALASSYESALAAAKAAQPQRDDRR